MVQNQESNGHDVRVRIAYLGPAGTYGHQAAKRFLLTIDEEAKDVELIPCPTIPDIYTHPAECLVMPLNNVIQGGVTETLDALLSPLAGPSTPRQRALSPPRIIADLDLPIRHSLVAKRGTKIKDIQWVRSHEQALGQCSEFLRRNLAGAKQVSWPSTAGAAMSLLSESSDSGIGAAICSASAVDDESELEVLHEGTQAIDDNFTRFLLLTRLPHVPGDKSPSSSASSHFYALTHPSLLYHLNPISAIRAIHTRPNPPIPSSSTAESDSVFDSEFEAELHTNGTAQSDYKDSDGRLGTEERYPNLLLIETAQVAYEGLDMGVEGMRYLGSAVYMASTPPVV